MSRPVVSALVVTYQTGPRLRECLHALLGDGQVSEIVVVDNGNPPREADWLDAKAAEGGKLRLTRPRQNLGFGMACNLAAHEATGNLLLFINPDAVMKRGSVAALVQAGAGRKAPWLVGGRIFDLSGRELRGCRRRKLTLARALGLGRWTLDHKPEPDGPVEVDAVSGAFFMMSKTQFLGLDGGFDTGYFLHVEDVDLCRRVQEAGGTVVYQPGAGALHYGATSAVPARTVARHKARSLKRYFRKFARNPLDRLANLVLLPLIAWAVEARARKT